MPPRLSCSARSSVGRALQRTIVPTRAPILVVQNATSLASRHYATAGSSGLLSLKLPDDYIPPTQPPSARRPELRKTQLLRTYTAMLRSTPLMLFFQHNNLTAVEWAAVRRELRAALAAVPPPVAGPDGTVPVDITSKVEFQVLRSRIFNHACKLVEYFDPEEVKGNAPSTYNHDLSKAAYESIEGVTVDEETTYAQINPLVIGPVAVINFPSVSPAHLNAVLRVLAPSPPQFPPPPRKKNPGYYEAVAQNGLQKLILIGSRVEGRAFDNDGLKWVSSIEGGVNSLRAQLVALLQSAGLGITTALEGHSKGLWLTLESRRTQMDEEANGGKKESEADATSA